jgi:NAD+ diphosphatase
MRHGESVTFGGSGLDRAVHLRADAARLADLAADPASRTLALWRGKPLLAGEAALGWLPPGHAMLAEAKVPPVFLGLDDGAARFAADISAWSPPDLAEAAFHGFFDGTEQRHPAAPEGWRLAELRGAMFRLSPREAELAATAKGITGWHATHRFCARCGQPSDVVMAGWQRRCPSCGAHHFPRTDPVVIMLITHGNSVLLGRSPAWPEGMYSLLAGFMEPGETIESAVRREVLEETAVRVGAVRYLASQPWPYPGSLMLGCHGEAESREITLDPVEIEDARWIPREELAEVFGGRHAAIRAPRQGAIAHFLLGNWLADRLD